jgi:hypothetical protein
MSIILIQALWVSGFSFALHEFFHFLIAKFPNRKLKKPFSCVTCLSFWIGLISSILLLDPLLIFIPFVLTKIINKFLWN